MPTPAAKASPAKNIVSKVSKQIVKDDSDSDDDSDEDDADDLAAAGSSDDDDDSDDSELDLNAIMNKQQAAKA